MIERWNKWPRIKPSFVNVKSIFFPRGIVAKFERRKDRNKVLSKAIAKLKNNKQFIVHEQYPIEIIDRRRQLVPIMKDARFYLQNCQNYCFL
jgi:hypothetical protein